MIGIQTGLPLPSLKEICLQLTVYFLVEDYGNYWIHRWLHSEWAYNNIHYIHHEFTAPMSFSAPYSSVVEMILLGIPTFVGPALVPGHMITLWLWIALRQLEAIETHSGYVLNLSYFCVEVVQNGQSSWLKNYALLILNNGLIVSHSGTISHGVPQN
jgi:sterol desaturase/sphingolipid hydroxylase (fatty acid hydroxylase superfamily)